MKCSGYFKWLGIRVFAVTVIAFAGCTLEEEDVFEYGSRYSDRLAFTAGVTPGMMAGTRSFGPHLETVEEEWSLHTMSGSSVATRGLIAKFLNGKAGIIGFQYDNLDGSDLSPIAMDYSNNIEFEFSGDMLTSTGTTILWKDITKANLNVYAYTPKDLAELTVTSTTAPPMLDYTVPGQIDKQTDILVSSWKSTDQKDEAGLQMAYKNESIHLTFDHALTAICFKVGFECTVKSVAINNVYNKGKYNFADGKWTVDESSIVSYEFLTAVEGIPAVYLESGSDLIDSDDCFILMPQTLPEGAEIVLTCVDEAAETGEICYRAPIQGKVWEPGKLITYTLHKDKAPSTIYFDLALSDVTIETDAQGNGTYSGKVFKDGEEMNVSGTHKEGNHYYVYQSTVDNRAGIWNGDVCIPPAYPEIKAPNGQSWRDFITNNDNVESVIESWDANHNVVVTNAGRGWTKNRIHITGKVTCDLTIDNIYSIYQENRTAGTGSNQPDYRNTAGIAFIPSGNNAKVTINIVGDNRIGAVHYDNPPGNSNEIIFEGTGSLTVTDVDGVNTGFYQSETYYGLESKGDKGYWSNFWSSAIGNRDSPPGSDQSCGIVINSGIIFAGTTKAENCTAIGGGGNAYGGVTINGGTVTAVATTTGTAIGGGIGYGGAGGQGDVTISGGNVYAYNHENKWKCPSSAIGGAGSIHSEGAIGKVNITGGYVYAYSALGTAIGGGSSFNNKGGGASITISDGEVYAKTGDRNSSSIGGGTACSGTTANAYNGGSANITIKGNPIVRTGSIGGGGKGLGKGYIGSAHIQIYGGDIQAQFLLSAGTAQGDVPTFEMTNGMIRNSNTDDSDYLHVKPDGGAVYLEDGKVTISGGTIQNCSAGRGGAIYIEGVQGGASNASFEMTGGTIKNNESDSDGGAIYITDGTAILSGGSIEDNLAAGGNGGGIFLQRGWLTVDGATIQNNSTEIRRNGDSYVGGNGGGIFVFSDDGDVKVDITSGLILENTADRKGAGVCVDVPQNSSNVAEVTIGTEGGSYESIRIENNHALQQGGGVYVRGKNSHITINSGTIMYNTVSQYVYNQNVANEQGVVVLNGGNVTHNDVRFHINDGKDPEPEPVVQKIVRSTNSELAAPDFTRTGYIFDGWNTKANGRGETYRNGQIMNINEDIDLYAQWKVAVSQ